MTVEVVQEEHVPDNSSVVAGAGQGVEGSPDGAAAEERSNLPEQQNGYHVGRPDSDETMQDAPEQESHKLLDLFDLLQHPDGHQEPSDPEEGVHCKISSRGKSGHSWHAEDLNAFRPVPDVGESDPLIVAVDHPEDRQHLYPVKEQQVLVCMGLRDGHDLGEVVVETEAFDDIHCLRLAARHQTQQGSS